MCIKPLILLEPDGETEGFLLSGSSLEDEHDVMGRVRSMNHSLLTEEQKRLSEAVGFGGHGSAKKQEKIW